MCELEETDDDLCDHYEGAVLISNWALSRIGAFRARLEMKAVEAHGFIYRLEKEMTNLLNKTFGFCGWSSEIVDCVCFRVQESDSFLCSVKLRVILRDGSKALGKGSSASRYSTLPMRKIQALKRKAFFNALKDTMNRFVERAT